MRTHTKIASFLRGKVVLTRWIVFLSSCVCVCVCVGVRGSLWFWLWFWLCKYDFIFYFVCMCGFVFHGSYRVMRLTQHLKNFHTDFVAVKIWARARKALLAFLKFLTKGFFFISQTGLQYIWNCFDHIFKIFRAMFANELNSPAAISL